MLKRITLHNFMSHSHTVIDLSAGLTVLTGPNNCGKSAFVTALQILAENTSGDFMVRHGEKECRVIVETDDEHTIEWKRKKKTVSYCVDGEDFHRLRNDVPDKLRSLLRLSKVKSGDSDQFDVHFGEQKSPIFLLNDRGSRAARFFASSSDASVLIEMQKLHRSKVKSAQQEFQRLQTESKQINAILEALAPVPTLESKLEALETTYESLQSENQQIQRLEALIQDLEASSQTVTNLRKTVTALNELPVELTQKNEKPLESLIRRSVAVKQQVELTHLNVSVMATLNEPPELEEVTVLDSLIYDIEVQQQRSDRDNLTVECLKALSDPPQLVESGRLQTTIENLILAEERVRVDQIEFMILEKCSSPPELADLDKIEQFYRQWEEASSQFDSRQQNYHVCEKEYELIRAEMVNWVKENPTCPTCGAEMDPEQFIQSAEVGLKGHTHGT
ncbi:AAA family ATPase [Gimesia aquarii]|uniref:Chromosome segregation protein n=1 Tax=Gimesia aquarii TaxID=2527964 RepID=A0A517VVP5_9PLAN|nr:AAA family ATPase [Gimesia aquarii]QDT97083.1 chromosome segregation protein [Gimesia aquarii]